MTDQTQTDIACKALSLKQAGEADKDYLEHQAPTSGEGPISGVNANEPVSGALDAEGHRPVLERSRKVR